MCFLAWLIVCHQGFELRDYSSHESQGIYALFFDELWALAWSRGSSLLLSLLWLGLYSHFGLLKDWIGTTWYLNLEMIHHRFDGYFHGRLAWIGGIVHYHTFGVGGSLRFTGDWLHRLGVLVVLVDLRDVKIQHLLYLSLLGYWWFWLNITLDTRIRHTLFLRHILFHNYSDLGFLWRQNRRFRSILGSRFVNYRCCGADLVFEENMEILRIF